MIILKEEINHLCCEVHSLARWKLVVVGTFAAVGLGVTTVKLEENV